jgi:hypothetical protein
LFLAVARIFTSLVYLSVAKVVVATEVVVLIAIVVKGRLTQKLSLKVDDDAFVEVDVDGVVYAVDGPSLLRLMSTRQDMSSRLN